MPATIHASQRMPATTKAFDILNMKDTRFYANSIYLSPSDSRSCTLPFNVLRLNFRHTRDAHSATHSLTHSLAHTIASHFKFVMNSFARKCIPFKMVVAFTTRYFRASFAHSLAIHLFCLGFCSQINFNLTQFQRSYFTVPFRLIQNANARALSIYLPLFLSLLSHSLTHTTYQSHLTISHLRQNINNAQ